MDFAESDPAVKSAKKDLNISDSEEQELGNNIMSIGVSARKPA